MLLVFVTIGVFMLFFVLMSVRLLFVKNGEFRGTCASQSPWLNKDGVTCGYCGKTLGEGESCGKDEGAEGNTVSLPEIRKKS